MDKLLPHKNFSLEDMDGEIWKDIERCEGRYQMSNFGRLKSLSRIIDNKRGTYILKEKIIALYINKLGYVIFSIKINNKQFNFLAHRVVATLFVENKKINSEVNHIDRIRSNNVFTNLEWVSRAENGCHRSLNIKKTSKYIGVSIDKKMKINIWKSQIQINNKKIHLGFFKTEEEAYQSRCNYEKNNNIENKYL
jgi:hypothetical protein